MPCRMDDMPSNYGIEEKLAKAMADGDLATKHLCTVLEHYEAHAQSAFDELPSSVKKWWTAHKEVDMKRRQKEDIQKQIDALQKKLKSL